MRPPSGTIEVSYPAADLAIRGPTVGPSHLSQSSRRKFTMQQRVAFSVVWCVVALALSTPSVTFGQDSSASKKTPTTGKSTPKTTPARNVRTTTSRTSTRTPSRTTPAKSGSSTGLRDRSRTAARSSATGRSNTSRTANRSGASKNFRLDDKNTGVEKSATGAATKSGDAKSREGKKAAKKEPEGFVAKALTFVKENSTVLISTLSVGLLGVLSWMFLAGKRSKRKSEEFLEPLDDELEAARPVDDGEKRYSSTRLRASDVNARLAGKSGSVTSETVETDQEYAFVVDEDELGRTEIDLNTGRAFANDREIRQHIDARRFDAAYDTYVEIVRNDHEVEFHKEIESTLGEHFIRAKELQKAAQVLEHQVATHAPEEVDPETFFNLGYIHFQTKQIERSKKFFQLFVQRDKRPEYVQRAQKILESMGGGVSQN